MNAAEQLALVRMHYWSEVVMLYRTYPPEVGPDYGRLRYVIALHQFEAAREMATQLGVLAE